MYAVCLQQLNIQPGNKFLDIGSGRELFIMDTDLFLGCGHFTAIGGYLAGKVLF